MNKRLAALFVILSTTVSAKALEPPPITSVRQVISLSRREAALSRKVSLIATVTYYRESDGRVFLQDGNAAVFAWTDRSTKLLPGDRVRIDATTEVGFVTDLHAQSVAVLEHGQMPSPVPVTFGQMISGKSNRLYIQTTGYIRSADFSPYPGDHSARLELAMDGDTVLVQVDNPAGLTQEQLIDSHVQITGVQGGVLDGKGQLTGLKINVANAAGIRVLERAPIDPWTLPLTSMSRIIAAYGREANRSRVRVEGTLIYYQPGVMAVLQDHSESLRIFTHSSQPLRVGEVVSAIGFPGVEKQQLALLSSELRSSGRVAGIQPVFIDWKTAMRGRYSSDLVEMSGRLVAQVREAGHDVFVLDSESNLISAVLPLPDSALAAAKGKLTKLPLGSQVRITGVLILQSGDRDHPLPFEIYLRTPDDIRVTQPPSWFTREHLVFVVLAVLSLLLGSGLWGAMLKRKVRLQTQVIAAKIRAEAELERHRSQILESINGARPLPEIMRDITALVSNEIGGAACWCRFEEEESIGNCPIDPLDPLGLVSEEILGRDGEALGVIFAKVANDSVDAVEVRSSLAVGSALATLAINTRRVYADLRRHAEYDILTDTHNRFSLERRLDALIAERHGAGNFGVIYIDLDRFKQVNDRYGHAVGDLFLQEVAGRIKKRLRASDFFARIGGDEFAVLIPDANSAEDIAEIAGRVLQVFETPFLVDVVGPIDAGASIGTALYPQEGGTRDEILSAADQEMYRQKYAKRCTNRV